MFKTNDERLDGVISFIHEYFPDCEALMEKLVQNLGAQKNPIANALSLGSRSDKSDNETKRRNGIRTLLFLAFVEAKQPVGAASQLLQRYSSLTLEQIKGQVTGRLPYYESNAPMRALWGAGGFTPVNGQGLQNAPGAFRYHVFGMMNVLPVAGKSYLEILADPSILKSFMLSTSLISQARRATYYPYGFILTAPPETIISTNTSDQAFKNYSRNAEAAVEIRNDQRGELRRVAARYPFLSPDQVLAGTRGAQGPYGYNEVAVLGTAPSGQTINIVGMFMKVDTAGGRYQIEKAPTRFVTDDIFRRMQLTNLPIIAITDTSGQTG